MGLVPGGLPGPGGCLLAGRGGGVCLVPGVGGWGWWCLPGLGGSAWSGGSGPGGFSLPGGSPCSETPLCEQNHTHV